MKRILFLGLTLIVLVAGGSALATIPGPDGVIHSCMLKAVGTIAGAETRMGDGGEGRGASRVGHHFLCLGRLSRASRTP